jgi:hypothetical protein
MRTESTWSKWFSTKDDLAQKGGKGTKTKNTIALKDIGESISLYAYKKILVSVRFIIVIT